MEIWELGAKSIREKVLTREISAQEVLDSYLARTAEVEPKIGAYLDLVEPQARLDAARVDASIMRGEDPGLLAGLPVGLKDNLNMKGAQCTCGSRILEGYVSPYDATAVKKLRKAGAVFTGKTNCDEFAMGSSTENSAFGVTRNPWTSRECPAVPAGAPPRPLPRDGAVILGFGHRWVDKAAGQLHGDLRSETYIRPGFTIRPGGLRLIFGPDRSFWQQRL